MASFEQARETRRLVFSGRVQGVGFRWTARRIATRFEIAGYVRNLSNGTVELKVQATPDVRTTFVQEIRDTFRDHIDNCAEFEDHDGTKFESFEIRH